MRKRIVTILLLPIIIFVFIIGWVMYQLGKQHTNTDREPPRKPNAAKEAETDEKDYVEIGVIEELMEKQLKAEQ